MAPAHAPGLCADNGAVPARLCRLTHETSSQTGIVPSPTMCGSTYARYAVCYCAQSAGAAVWAAVNTAPQQGLPKPGERRQLNHQTGRGQQRAAQGWVRGCDAQCQCSDPSLFSTAAHGLDLHGAHHAKRALGPRGTTAVHLTHSLRPIDPSVHGKGRFCAVMAACCCTTSQAAATARTAYWREAQAPAVAAAARRAPAPLRPSSPPSCW